MNNDGGAIGFEAYIQTDEFKRGIAVMNRDINGFTKNAVSESQKVGDTFKQLGQLAAGAFAFNELASLPKKLIDVRGEFQNLEIAYTTMLGSKTKADALFKDVVKFAATTPFDLQGVASASKQLLAYGIASEDVIGTLRRLGDISAGLTIPLGELTELYGKTKTNGRLFAEDLNQYVGRGIPLIKLLADQFQVAESEVRGLVEAGKVGFPEVQKAIGKLTDSGGMFAGLMEEQSKGLKGLYANFEDVIAQAFNNIGKEQEGLLGDSIKFATSVVQNYDPILDVLKVIIATYGTYKAAVIATAAVQALSANAGAISAFFQLAGSIKSAADAQALFNLVTKANPYAVAAAALIGLITAVALFRNETTEATKAKDRMNEAMLESEKQMNSEIANITVLRQQITDETKTRDQKNTKLKELIALNPTILSGITLENAATNQSTIAINGYIRAKKEQIRVSQIQAQIDQNLNRISEITSGKSDKEFQPSALSKYGLYQAAAATGGKINVNQEIEKEVKAQKDKAVKGLQDLNKDLMKDVNNGIEQRRALRNKAAQEDPPPAFKNVPYYEKEIEKLKDLQKLQSGNNAEFVKYQKQIDELEKAKNRITGKQTDAEKAAAKAADKEADKSGPYGSESYWNFIASKAKEILSKTPIDQKDKVNEQVQIISDAEKNAQNARKAVTVKSFEDELEEKKKLYQQYQQWVEIFNEKDNKTANDHFDGLITQGKSYAEYLKNQIDDLQSVHPESLTGKEQDKLVKLKIEYSDATNAEKPLEAFQKRLDVIRNSATSLTDEIEKLKAVQAELGTTDMSPDAIFKRQTTQQQLNQANQERGNQFRSFLVEVAGSEQKRLDIENRFRSQRVELEKQYGTQKGQIYEDALKAINAAEQEEYEKDKLILAEKSKEFKAFAKIMQKSNEDLSGGDIKTARENFKKFTANLDKNSEEYKKYLQDLEKLEESHRKKSIQTWGLVADGIGQLGGIMSELGGSFGAIGNALNGIASQAGNYTRVLNGMKTENNKTTLSTDGYAAAISGVINLIGIVTSATQRRREAERQYYQDAIAFENDYQNALNKRLGTSYKDNENPYVNDIEAKIKAGVAQQEDAYKKYEASIEKLNAGKAKTGQKIGVDGKAVAAGAVAGAAAGVGSAVLIGAALGTVVGPVGTAIGAVAGLIVGGLTGLFGGKKKKDTFGGLLDQYPELVKESVDGWKSINVELANALIANNQVDDKTKEMLKTAVDYNDALQESAKQIEDGIVELTGQMGESIKNSLVTAFQEGTDAAQAFGDAVGDIMGNVVKQLLFTELMKPALDKFKKEAIDSYSLGGDQSLLDDLDRFKEYGMPGAQLYVKTLEEYDKWMKDNGYDKGLGKTSSSSTSALSGAIQGMSESTAGVLEGQINAIRITQADSNSLMRQQLLHMANISTNSNYLRYLTVLDSIDTTLKSLKTTDSFNREFGG